MPHIKVSKICPFKVIATLLMVRIEALFIYLKFHSFIQATPKLSISVVGMCGAVAIGLASPSMGDAT